MAKLITLKAWRASIYDEAELPHVNTVRLWIKHHLIVPAPQKQGRAYYFSPDARYRAHGEPAERLAERIRRTA